MQSVVSPGSPLSDGPLVQLKLVPHVIYCQSGVPWLVWLIRIKSPGRVRRDDGKLGMFEILIYHQLCYQLRLGSPYLGCVLYLERNGWSPRTSWCASC